jgi:hypothetical protein
VPPRKDLVLSKQVKADRSISIRIQDVAPPVPTLRHMLWDINGNHPSESSHDWKRYQESLRHAAPDPHTCYKDEEALIFYSRSP